jgi:integrase/recombinase XerD
MRIGEAIALRVNDVEARDHSPRLRVYGKGGRRRVIPVGAEVIEAVDAYLTIRQERLGSYRATDELFVCADGRPFSRGTLDNLVSTWFRRAGVAPPPGTLAHALRHTYATLLVDNGASLPELQRLLGHRDLSTTQVYLGVTGSGLQQTAMSNPARASCASPLPQSTAIEMRRCIGGTSVHRRCALPLLPSPPGGRRAKILGCPRSRALIRGSFTRS